MQFFSSSELSFPHKIQRNESFPSVRQCTPQHHNQSRLPKARLSITSNTEQQITFIPPITSSVSPHRRHTAHDAQKKQPLFQLAGNPATLTVDSSLLDASNARSSHRFLVVFLLLPPAMVAAARLAFREGADAAPSFGVAAPLPGPSEFVADNSSASSTLSSSTPTPVPDRPVPPRFSTFCPNFPTSPRNHVLVTDGGVAVDSSIGARLPSPSI